MADGPESDADAIRRLEQRLDRAAQTAERLLADAVAAGAGGAARAAGAGGAAQAAGAARAAGAGAAAGVDEAGAAAGVAGAAGSDDAAPAASSPPQGGWQRPASETSGARRGGDELELLLSVLGAMRDWIPAELQQRLTEAIRDVLLALRALIDWYLERTQRRAGGDDERVQDIPIL